MENNKPDNLKTIRDGNLKTLGSLCYSLCEDGVMVFSEMTDIVTQIKKSLNFLSVLRGNDNISKDYLKLQETELDKMLTELGCICYNLYNDKKLVNRDVLILCDTIMNINGRMMDESIEADTFVDKAIDFNLEASMPETSDEEQPNRKLKVTCPAGLEPIPVNYKKCSCTYHNRHDAIYCARCGTKLL
ncbi:MAG: hypothetical protein E7395_02245 [Ruminococcaceae bacterium]|nr:hypothetical protein [Oscillospiraceae bacterium]